MGLQLSSKTYDFIKHLVRVVLPAIGALYFGLGNYWSFPNIEEVVGSIAVFTTFLGVVMGVSDKNYIASGAAFDGTFLVKEDPEGHTKFKLDLSEVPDDLAKKDQFRIKVQKSYLDESFIPPDGVVDLE